MSKESPEKEESSGPKKYMAMAIEAAQKGAAAGEVPVGAVLVHAATGKVVAAAHNLTETIHDPTAHAEVVVIRNICDKTSQTRLPDFDLYVTLEPCAMCAAAISFARIRRVYYGAYDPKGGGVDHGPKFFQQPTCHHAPEVYGGIQEAECARLLKGFFEGKRG